MNIYIKNIIRAVILITVQAFFLNKISPLHGIIIPYVYILFILWLPINFSKPALLILAFLLGTLMDILLLTPGLHASASLMVAYFRGYYLNLMVTSYKLDSYNTKEPSISNFSFFTYLIYLSVFSLIHNFFIFFIARLTFTNFFHTLLQVILSTVYSIVFMLLIEFVFQRKEKQTIL